MAIITASSVPLPASTAIGPALSSILRVTSSSSLSSTRSLQSFISSNDTSSNSLGAPSPSPSTNATAIFTATITTTTEFDRLPTATSPTSEASISRSGFSRSAERITILTTIIGGTILITLLLWFFRRRRGRTSASGMLLYKHNDPSEILLSEPRLTALPIYREDRFSIRSSIHASRISLPSPAPRSSMRPSPKVPDTLEHLRQQSIPLPSSPPLPAKPEKAVLEHGRRLSSAPGGKKLSKSKPKPVVSMIEVPHDMADSQEDTAEGSRRTRSDRWSWTNSQAPSTPRLRATSFRLPRFLSPQPSPRPPPTNPSHAWPSNPTSTSREPSFKNKAAHPTLTPPVTTITEEARPR